MRILFVCHGNICRSPMAEFVMKQLVEEAGLADQFEIASAATSTEEIGNGVYPPVRRLLLRHGIDPAGKTARQMRRSDYDSYDLLIGMDGENIRNMRRICGGTPRGKSGVCWTMHRRRAISPIRGTPGILTGHGGMCRRGAVRCWHI